MAIAFDNQKWLDDFYKETGDRGWFDGRLYTADYLRWCVKRAAELMEEQYTSTNTPSAKCYSIECPAIWNDKCTSLKYNECLDNQVE